VLESAAAGPIAGVVWDVHRPVFIGIGFGRQAASDPGVVCHESSGAYTQQRGDEQ
jgi:hypothetical protein